MGTVLGLSNAERIAPQMDEVIAGDASLIWLQIGDSNLTQGGGGYGRTRRLALGRILRIPQVASHTATTGLFTAQQISYSSDGSTADYAPDTLRSVANGGQGDQFHIDDYTHAEVPAVLRPFLPTTAAMLAVDLFVPMMPEPGDQLGSPRYALIHNESDEYDYDFEEDFNVWICHPRESSLGSHPWQVRKTTGSANITNGTIDQSPVGAPTGTASIVVEQLGSTVTGQSMANGEVVQFMPYGNLQTPAGNPTDGPLTMILSMFATWPDRGHGYVVAPLVADGAGSLGEYVSALADADDEWTDWKLIAACAAMEGKRAHVVVEIQHALNDNTDEATFLTRLTTAAEHNLARFDALKASGAIPSTVIDAVVLYSGCIHRIPAATEDLSYCYNAARTLAGTNGRVCVADFRALMAEAEFAVIGDGGAHLNSDADYLKHDRRWVSRFVTACRLERGLRSAA